MKQIGLKLREAYRSHGVEKGNLILREAIKENKINPNRLSIRGLAEGFFGEDDLEGHLKRASYQYRQTGFNVREATVTDSSGFYAVTGQILIDRVQPKYDLATRISKTIFDTQAVTNGNLQTYRQQRVSRVPDFGQTVEQGTSYPSTQFGQLYIDLPAPQKFGEQCNVTIELILSDQTQMIYDMADSVGEMTGWEEERRKMRVFLGIVNPYSQNGTAANTYRSSGSWINLLNDFTLLDYRSINRLEMTLRTQTDPQSGLPLNGTVEDLFVMPTARYTAKRIINATEVRSNGTSTGDLLVSDNPIDSNIKMIETSQYPNVLAVAEGSYTQAKADTITIAGRFKKAFVWREVYPMKVEQLPPGAERNFDKDIAYSVKASCFGVAGVLEPREVVLGYNNSAS